MNRRTWDLKPYERRITPIFNMEDEKKYLGSGFGIGTLAGLLMPFGGRQLAESIFGKGKKSKGGKKKVGKKKGGKKK